MEQQVDKLNKKIKELEIELAQYKKSLAVMRESEENYRNLIEMAPDGIVTLNTKGVITSWNAAAEKFTGYSKEELIGKHFSRLGSLNLKDIPNYLKTFTSIIKGEVPKPFEAVWYGKDGAENFTEVRIGLIKKRGRLSSLQVIARDINEHKRIQKELEAKNRELEKINNVLVGRELKMIQLKKKIEELEKRIIEIKKVP